jgi:hypothetical protein
MSRCFVDRVTTRAFVSSLQVSVCCRARKENAVCKLLPDVELRRRIITFTVQIKAYVHPLQVYLSPMIQL